MFISSYLNNTAYNSPLREFKPSIAPLETPNQPLVIGYFMEFVLSGLDTHEIFHTYVFYRKNNNIVKRTTGKRKLIGSSKGETIINDVVVVEDIQNLVSIVTKGVKIL